MEIRKEIIRPGTYTYIDPRTNKPEKLTVTTDTIKHFHKTGSDMLKAGLSVPVPIEHQADAVPMTESERAAKQLKDNGGWVSGYEIGEVKQKINGKETVVKDVLFGKLDIQDQSIVDKLPKTIRFVSPHINSFTDGAGKKWDSVISHVALTTRPRITNQEPFAPNMAAALSLVSALQPLRDLKDGISLSKAGLLKAGKKTLPVYPLAFSLLSGIKLSEEEMKKVEEEEEKDEEEFDEEEEEGDENKSPIEKAIDGNDNSQSDVKIHEVICHMLKVLGFEPPQNMDKTTFERDIYETLMAKLIEVGAKVGDEDEEVPELEEEDEERNPIVEEHPTMYASLEEVNKIADPKERKLAGMMFALQQENDKNKKKAEAVSLSIIANYKEVRKERVKNLLKRLPATRREKLQKLFSDDAKLSLSEDGVVVDPMQAVLDAFEEATPDLPNLLTKDGKSFSEQTHPKEDGQMTEERRKELVGALAANSPPPPESVNLSHAGAAFAAEVAKWMKSTNGDKSGN